MRQAGRYLPEYRKLREDFAAPHKSFIDFCLDPVTATRAALQPIKRFPNLSAAILFSDILTIPFALGITPDFSAGSPRLAALREPAQITALIEQYKSCSNEVVNQKLNPVGKSVQLLKKELPATIPLIGFAASPWTLACYLIQGNSTPGFPATQQFLDQHPNTYLQLSALLEEYIIALLWMQQQAGADILQIFDSWGGLAPEEHFEKVISDPLIRIAATVAQWNVPLIIHARSPAATPFNWQRLCSQLPATPGFQRAISPDAKTDLTELLPSLPDDIVLQGNLDPELFTPSRPLSELKAALDRLAQILRNRPWICNLGAGLSPASDLERVQSLFDFLDAFRETSQ